MARLNKLEMLQLAAIVVGISGLVAGAILMEPLVIGAGVIGAGAAAATRLASHRMTANTPDPGGKAQPTEPHISATATAVVEREQRETAAHAKRKIA
jgi:hypothetical protein